MKYKHDLDREVASSTELPLAVVRKVTRDFLAKIAQGLATDQEVDLSGFAVLRVAIIHSYAGISASQYEDGCMDKIYVRFYKKSALKRVLATQRKNDMSMDKFGVDESLTLPTDDEKRAAPTKCPKCGGKVTAHGKTLICENCGSAPFEGA